MLSTRVSSDSWWLTRLLNCIYHKENYAEEIHWQFSRFYWSPRDQQWMVFHLTEELPEISWIKIQFTHTIKIQRNTINLYLKLKLKTYIIKYTKIHSQYLAYQIRKDSQIKFQQNLVDNHYTWYIWNSSSPQTSITWLEKDSYVNTVRIQSIFELIEVVFSVLIYKVKENTIGLYKILPYLNIPSLWLASKELRPESAEHQPTTYDYLSSFSCPENLTWT